MGSGQLSIFIKAASLAFEQTDNCNSFLPTSSFTSFLRGPIRQMRKRSTVCVSQVNTLLNEARS